MTRLSYSDFSESHRKFSAGKAFYCVFSSFVQDFLLYNLIIPLIGISTCGIFVSKYELTPRNETALVVGVTFMMLYIAFSMFGEACFWRSLFALNQFYVLLLQVRDVLNIIVLICCVVFLEHSVDQMMLDRQMKPYHLGEGTGYFVMKFIAVQVNAYPRLLETFGWTLPNSRVGSGENQRFLHGGAYILAWAMLAGCVAKLVYFNTLFTYIRSMRIFISLRPTFEDDGASLLSDSSSSSDSSRSDDSIEVDQGKTRDRLSISPRSRSRRHHY